MAKLNKRRRSFAQRYPTGRELLPWLRRKSACDDAIVWVATHEKQTLRWLWVTCDRGDWLYWLLSIVIGKRYGEGGWEVFDDEYCRAHYREGGAFGAGEVRAIAARVWPPGGKRD